ncbi:hypothetical protein H0H92_008931 [Tricholoma furcatifolium]|nr:hypothetical protein H0H92_008931 [Tricholoma furcatifolium]
MISTRTKAFFHLFRRPSSGNRTLFSNSRATPPQSAMRFINRDELAHIIKSSVAKKDFIVVDVRDDDFAGGNIKGAINKPSNDFLRSVDGLVQDTKDIPLVVFHCALSQVRGPKAARIYEETRQNVLDGKDIPHEVVVLRDGFTQFQKKFKDDPDLVENWDKDVWEELEWH